MILGKDEVEMKKVLGLKTLLFLLSVLFAFGVWAKDVSFDKFKDHTWVRGEGEVTRLLEDDLEPPCHQRFIIKDSRDKTLLIVNNIDSWPRLAGVKVGDLVEFRGEFIQNEKGGLVHWTHPDPSGRKKSGFVKIKKSAPETPQEPEEEVILPAVRREYRAGGGPISERIAAPVNEDWPETGYWLSTNSDARHNKKCENYRKTRGYPCKKSEDRPCGKCGG